VTEYRLKDIGNSTSFCTLAPNDGCSLLGATPNFKKTYMTTLDKIKTFLQIANDISFGYSEINFCNPDNLDNEQIGYSVDESGNSLVTGDDGSWPQEWLVIASDELGDPIIIDMSSTELTVLSAVHGDDIWESFIIADSVNNFKEIISLLTDLSKDRTNPVDLEKNPMTAKERQDVLEKIEKQNPGTELWFWEAFLETD